MITPVEKQYLRKKFSDFTIVSIEEIDPEADPRVQIDNRNAAEIPVTERCRRCQGTGNELLFMYRRCGECGGTGRQVSHGGK